MNLHTNPRVLLILLVLLLIGFTLLGILALRQFDHPLDHYWNLLVHDRIVDMIMFDFFFFFVWVYFWMTDRGKSAGRVVFLWLRIGVIAATLMIYLYILTGRKTDQRQGWCTCGNTCFFHFG
jgi:uncharacterized BrkB/YihY/UPF0761 family membrane protein